MNELDVFIEFIEFNMIDRFIKDIIVTVNRKIYSSYQYTFNNLSVNEANILTSLLTDRQIILDFISNFKEGMIFIVRFDNVNIHIIIKNKIGQEFFQMSIKWYFKKLNSDAVRVSTFSNSPEILIKYKSLTDLFNNVSSLSCSNDVIEIKFNKLSTNDEITDLYNSLFILLETLNDSFQIVSTVTYVLFIEKLKHKDVVEDSIEIHRNGSFVITSRNRNS